MLNRIIRSSLDNRLIVVILSFILLGAGVVQLMRTEVDIFPDLNSPTVTIMTECPGFSTEDVEQLVTFQIETAVTGAQGVKTVRSSSTEGFSVVEVIFNDDVDIYIARQTVAERLQIVSALLPRGVDAPVMGPQSSILGEIMIIAMHSDTVPVDELRDIADRVVAPSLRAVSGVSSVSVLGGGERQFRISVNPALLAYYGLTLSEVTDAVRDLNGYTAGGIANAGGNEFVVKTSVATDVLEDIAATVVANKDGMIVTLSDLGEIEPAVAEPRIGAASYNGKSAVMLTVTKQPHVGTIGLTERLDKRIEEFRHSLGDDIVFSTDLFRQSDFIDRSISNLGSSLFEGALMVIVVLFFFMMNLRATLVSLLALPMSIIVTLLILHGLGLNVNTMTLGGIAIAIGSLVDDAIVDVENVYRHLMRRAEMPVETRPGLLHTIYEASREVRMPIFNSSLIIVAGFLPLFFLSGVEGRMMAPLGISFIIALASSTIVALTLTPVLCSYLLGAKGQARLSHEPKAARWIKTRYKYGLSKATSHGRAVIVATMIMLIGAAVWYCTLGHGFMPAFNEGSFTINVSALPGITLDDSDKIGRMAEELIMKTPEVVAVGRKTGRAELDEHILGTSVSEIEVPYKLSGRSKQEVMNEIRNNLSALPGVVVEIGQPISHRIDAMMSGTEAAVVVKIFGDNLDRLLRCANKARSVMSEVDGLVDISVEQIIDRPQIVVRPRRQAMAMYGVTPADLNDFVGALMTGTEVSQLVEQGYTRPVTLKLSGGNVNAADDLGDIAVMTPNGATTLSQLADIISTTGPNKINRENASRRIIVSANVEGRDLGSAVKEMTALLESEVDLPHGYTMQIGGRWESASTSARTLMLASLLAIVIIFILLYAEFRNLTQAAIILINMPLAIIGGIAAVGLTGSEIDIPAIIGFIALIGIATRNGMLLISRYNSLRADGLSVDSAVYQGSVDRLLPIIMTALSSALALLPIALRSGEPGNELQSPLAIVILGGLVSSTVLNLFVVPVVYRFVYNRRDKSVAEKVG